MFKVSCATSIGVDRLLIVRVRCVPKMDHHCPWTANCVSHRTFPHFFRFLFYSIVAMFYLEKFLYIRGAVIWAGRARASVCLAFVCIEMLVDDSATVPWAKRNTDRRSFHAIHSKFTGHFGHRTTFGPQCLDLGSQCHYHRKLGNRETR